MDCVFSSTCVCLLCGFWYLTNVHCLGLLKTISETELFPSSGGKKRGRLYSASLVTDSCPRSSNMLRPESFTVILHRFLLANKHKVLEARSGFIISRRTKPIVLRPSDRANFCPRKQLLKLYAFHSKLDHEIRSNGCMCQS